MFRTATLRALLMGAALVVAAGFSACGDHYEYEANYSDLVCDSSGCFHCDDGWCQVYSCFATHQCPTGRVCTLDNICLPADVSYTDGAGQTPAWPDTSTNGGGGPSGPGVCTAHEHCSPGEICTTEGDCVKSPGGGPGATTDTDPTGGASPDGGSAGGSADDGGQPTPDSGVGDGAGSDPAGDAGAGDGTDGGAGDGSGSDPSGSADGGSGDGSDPDSGGGDDPDSGTSGNTDVGSGGGDDTGVPLPDHPLDTCVINADCGLDGICLDAGCYFPCDAIGECPAGQMCDAGQCFPTDTPEVECTFNGECGPGLLCIEGLCYDDCAESLDCGDHEKCEAGLCVADTSPVIQCSGPGSCADGQGCFDGKCLDVCGESIACGEGSVCQYGYCQQVVSCLATADCPVEGVCLDGRCQTL